MGGTRAGGLKTVEKVIKRLGEDHYRKIGSIGGSRTHRESRPFYANRELARKAGAEGGKVSKRGKADVVKSEA
jgi:hypothetical protein